MTPKRIQLSRRKGWRKPEGCIVVSRPSKWGNPFTVADYRESADSLPNADDEREWLVDNHRWWLRHTQEGKRIADAARIELRGHDLACWCKPGTPCHADVLLEIANAEPPA